MCKKILINGAGGWLGTSSVKYLMKSPLHEEYELILLTSDGRDLTFNDISYKTTKIMEFDSKTTSNIIGIVNLAFLTKDKVKEMPLETYISTNKILMLKLSQFVSDLKPKWITTVSSGAAAKYSSTLEKDPYGFLKLQEESLIADLSDQFNNNYSIGRLWAAMGLDMPINRNYAISDLICQALEKSSIEVKATNKVFRQYCDSRTFMETCIRAAENQFNNTFDSGGFVTEIGELASYVASPLKIKNVLRELRAEAEIDEYLPKSSKYLELQRRLVIDSEISLENLIEKTIEGHKSNFFL